MNIKAKTFFAFIAFSFAFPGPLHAAGKIKPGGADCYPSIQVKVVELGVGVLSNAVLGADSGNAIQVTFQNIDAVQHTQTLTVNKNFNIGDTPGIGIFALLKMALTTGREVKVYDHHPPSCDDFDTIIIK